MKGARRFKNRLRKDLKNPDFREAFEEEEIFASIAIELARLREKEGLTQQELARLLHTSQQTISRLEDPDNTSCTVKTLVKIAHAMHKELEIRLV